MERGYWPAVEVDGELRPSLPPSKKGAQVAAPQPGALIQIERATTTNRRNGESRRDNEREMSGEPTEINGKPTEMNAESVA
jgi:hypothetical protein